MQADASERCALMDKAVGSGLRAVTPQAYVPEAA